jgi:hypothetical protein
VARGAVLSARLRLQAVAVGTVAAVAAGLAVGDAVAIDDTVVGPPPRLPPRFGPTIRVIMGDKRFGPTTRNVAPPAGPTAV